MLRDQVTLLIWPNHVRKPGKDDWSEEDIAVAYQHACIVRLRYLLKLGEVLIIMTLCVTLLTWQLKRSLWIAVFFLPVRILAAERVPIDIQITLPLRCKHKLFTSIIGPRLLGVVFVDFLNALDILGSLVAFYFDPHDFLINGSTVLMATNRFVFAMCSTSGISTLLSCIHLIGFHIVQRWIVVDAGCTHNLVIAFVCVALVCHYNEVLACSIIRKEHVKNLRECAYSSALVRLKTPLLLARSEMQAIDPSSKGLATVAAQKRIEELWQMLTNLMQADQPPMLHQNPNQVNAGSAAVAGRKADRPEALHHRKRRGQRRATWHGHNGAHIDPLIGIDESEEEGQEAKDEALQTESSHSSSGGRSAARMAAPRELPLPIEPIVCHLQELARHFPVSSCTEAREILREACLQMLWSPQPSAWDPCCGWKCELCHAMNDVEDTFCANCLCEQGMHQDQAGNDIEQVP